MDGKTAKVPGPPAIGAATVFNGLQSLEIFHIVRLHADSLSDMLQSRDLIAQAIIGQSAEVIPPGASLLDLLQHIQCFPVASEADVLGSGLLIGAAGLPTVSAEGVLPAEGIVTAKGVVSALAAVTGTTLDDIFLPTSGRLF